MLGNIGAWFFSSFAALGFLQHRADKVLIWRQGVSFLVSAVLLLSVGKETSCELS